MNKKIEGLTIIFGCHTFTFEYTDAVLMNDHFVIKYLNDYRRFEEILINAGIKTSVINKNTTNKYMFFWYRQRR
jgi:hypothetical protein